jgi:DNA-binding ferritin-like protein
LVELVDLPLLGKQFHWNVVGRRFSPMHLQLDDPVDSWRELPDTMAERARERMDPLGDLDAASQDVVIEVVRALEKQLWMIRAQFRHGGAR